MIQKIKTQIENINQSLAWIKKNKPADYDQKYLQLVDERRKLKKILVASENNPGIAAFGKSQVGKSYLVSCLLQDNGKPFLVKANNESYDFVLKINPPSEEGGGRESTGVVTRFSSYRRNPDLYKSECPVMVNTFSVIDVVTILADSYYNDIANYTDASENDLQELCESMKAKYGSRNQQLSPVVSADDILNMKEYFAQYINNAQVFNKRSPFFERLAVLIEKVPTEDYAEVFAVLWNYDRNFTELFRRMFNTLSTFGFARHIYLPIESVLHGGIREATIMSVQCLNQLFASSTQHVTDAYILEDGKLVKCATNIAKSEICAICAEIVYKIEEEFLDSTGSYCLDNIAPEVKPKLEKNEIKMTMLRDNDLLDFPGARSRLELDVNKISEKAADSEETQILQCLLRGKVAYLFNKYNREQNINILLFCHHNKDNDVTYLYKLLDSWVNTYVGKTPQERKKKIETTLASPLFFIGTMFNLDMTLGVGATVSEAAIDQRWLGRFDTVINKQCFMTDTVDWVKNWTGSGERFKNSFVLRDYKFSGPKTGLYEGYVDLNSRLTGTGRETKMLMASDYYEIMRKTFVNNQHVKNLFEDPAVAWDVAATINNDGSLRIIEKLATVAQQMNKSRDIDFQNILNKVQRNLEHMMEDYLVSTDLDKLLQTNIRKAYAVYREMDFTCNSDNYYFGHLLKALQISEKMSYRVIHAIMQSPEINSKVNDFKDYEIIRNSCKKKGFAIENAKSDAEKWECIAKTYMFSSIEESEEFLQKKGIDIRKLFDGSFKRKLNSCVIGDALFDEWCSMIKSVDFFNQFSDEKNFDESIMTTLVDNLIATANMMSIRDKMSDMIAEYVNVIDIHTANEDLLADLLASILNEFVLDFGYSYLSEEEVAKARRICENNSIPAFTYIDKEMPAVYEEADLTELFNNMSESPMALLPSFEDNYNKWIEYMFISFVAHLDIPEFDHEANEILAGILDNIRNA